MLESHKQRKIIILWFGTYFLKQALKLTSVFIRKAFKLFVEYPSKKVLSKNSHKQQSCLKNSHFIHSLGKSQQSTSKDNKRKSSANIENQTKSKLMTTLYQN